VAEELEIKYEHQNVDTKKDTKQDWFLAINPNGKVPALVDGDIKLFESAAICNYMVTKHPEKGLLPTSRPERAIYDQWMFFVMSELEQPLWSIGKHSFALPKEYRIEAMKKTALFEWDKAIKVLEIGLNSCGSGTYILGGNFSVPDIMITQTLQWARNFKVPINSDVVDKYRKTVTARPGFQRVVQKYFK
jgi:glutathione S-transferase